MTKSNSVYDLSILGPTASMLMKVVSDGSLRKWREAADAYLESMEGLGRAVLLWRDDKGDWYLSSIEERLP